MLNTAIITLSTRHTDGMASTHSAHILSQGQSCHLNISLTNVT